MKRILVIGMPFSIHTKRWIDGMLNLPLEIHFFSSFEYASSNLNSERIFYHDYSENRFKNSACNFSPIDNKNFKYLSSRPILNLMGKVKRKLSLKKSYSFYLARTIKKLDPDIIHTLETQHAGYLLYDALLNFNLKKDFIWVHSTWGIDLHYFLKFKDHKLKIKHLFNRIDVYCAEGERDTKLAKELGFAKSHYNFPSVGGYYEIDEFSIPTSERKIILLKGYNNEMRCGLNGLKALERANLDNDYTIVIYGADNTVLEHIKDSLLKSRIDIKSHLSHSEMIGLTKKSILSLTINLSDGLPNSFVEAMACGAFPIQSNTSMADEWIVNEETGFLVDPENINEIAEAIIKALSQKNKLDAASISNRNLFLKCFNKDIILSRMKQLYFNKE